MTNNLNFAKFYLTNNNYTLNKLRGKWSSVSLHKITIPS